jgi:crotonobetainyl-CoA:carnitine CoA-transferase CaiB-like acyl-CoA transferase
MAFEFPNSLSSENIMASDILAGVRVVELGEGIAVPYCGKLLADFGAEVVKIERPGSGDSTRHHGPFPGDEPHHERSGLFLALNTNKLGVTLDIESPTGRQMLGKLLHRFDILIHHTPLQHLSALHLTSEVLRQEYPRLIITSITPFGQSGPYCDYPSADITICALGGLSEGLGEENRPPLTAPFRQGGYQAGLSAAGAIVLALLVRESSGQGQTIDIGTADVLATLQTGVYLNNYLFDGSRSMRGHHFGSRTIYPAHFFRCLDGFMWVTAPQWAQWERLLEMVGRPDLAANKRFHNRHDIAATPPPELEVPLAQWFMEHTREDIFTLCRTHRLPITPVYTIAELVEHPQMVARGFILAVEQPGVGTLQLPGLPITLSKTPWRVRRPAPLLGEHNEKMYCQEVGYARHDLPALRRAGVI